MTKRKRSYIIIISAGLILLISGFGSSYFWLTRIYLPEQIDANTNAKKMKEWQAQDMFTPPADKRISRSQLQQFIQVNESLAFLLHRLHSQFEDHSWRFAFDMIEVQPEWTASKYLALKKHGLSPREYDWIFDQVVTFMIHRWKEETARKLSQYGWDISKIEVSESEMAVNYELFVENEDYLRRIFEFFWPQRSGKNVQFDDSL